MSSRLGDLRILWWLARYGLRYRGVWLLLVVATAIMAVCSGYLVMIIHRAIMVQSADVIHVLDGATGTISESGTHEERVARSGEPARLVRMHELR